jgi:hypothetical protein
MDTVGYAGLIPIHLPYQPIIMFARYVEPVTTTVLVVISYNMYGSYTQVIVSLAALKLIVLYRRAS